MPLHITLVGGQIDPVYQGILATKPHKIIYICSPQTKDDAQRLANEIKIENAIKEFSPVDIDKIKESIIQLTEDLKNESHITINITGGTKPWSIFLFDFFKDFENVTIFYIDQNNILWDLKKHSNQKVDFGIDDHFRINGNPLNHYIRFEQFTDEDKTAVKEIKKIRSINYKDFNELITSLNKNSNLTEYKTSKGSYLRWDSVEKSFSGIINSKRNENLRFNLKSPHIRHLLLNSGWFEYEVAEIFSTWRYAKEIRLNCIFKDNRGSDKNEIDIIINTGNKLLFVECKTQIFNTTDIDKFASSVRLYGGLGSKALFITQAPMSEKAKEKCQNHSIISFSFNESNENNENQLFSKELKTSLLLTFVESELFNINAK